MKNTTSPWTKEILFFKGDEYFDDILKHIRTAKKSIDLESYIYGNDKIGELFTQALIDAHKRGVKVRLLVDGFGSIEWINNQSEEAMDQGLDVRVYHPILLFRQFIKYDLGVNSILNISKNLYEAASLLSSGKPCRFCLFLISRSFAECKGKD